MFWVLTRAEKKEKKKKRKKGKEKEERDGSRNVQRQGRQ
jgi:hypothetical protein